MQAMPNAFWLRRSFPSPRNEINVNPMENANSTDEKALMKRWVETWKYITGPELERIKKEEVRALTDEQALQQMIRVMNSRVRHAREGAKYRTTSGLVEQQRIFAKAHRAAK